MYDNTYPLIYMYKAAEGEKKNEEDKKKRVALYLYLLWLEEEKIFYWASFDFRFSISSANLLLPRVL